MSVERKVIATGDWRGSHMAVRYMGPDLLLYVDGLEMPGFYIDTKSAFFGGRKYIDQQLKEQEDEESKING